MVNEPTRKAAMRELAKRELARRRSVAPAPSAPEGAPGAPAEAERFDPGALSASVNGGGQALTFGFGDEIGAGLFTPIEMGIQAYKGEPLSVSGAYDNALKRQRDQLHQDQDLHPVATTVGAVGAGLAMPSVAAKTTAGMIAQGVATGAATGFGTGEGGLENRLEGAKWGAGAGAAGAVIAKGIGNVIAKKAAAKAIPTTENLADASNALYRSADAAQVTIKAPAYNNVLGNAQIAAGRVNTTLRPKTAGVLEDMKAMAGKNVTLSEFDELRQGIGKALKNAEPQDERTLMRIQKQLDAFPDRLTASDITGDMRGFEHIKEARKLWAMKSKSETIEALFERAKTTAPNFSGSGMENALRIEFRQLAKNAQKLKRFSAEEQAAIIKVARGGAIENTLRQLGKFAPTGVVSAALSGGIGASVAGPIGAAALPAAGMAARQAATKATMGNVSKVDQLIRSGGKTLAQIVKEGRAGQGIGALGAQKGRALNDMVRVPLSLTLASEASRRR